MRNRLLAAGHGRNSAKLLPLTASLYIVDINSDNIEACKKRFTSVDGHEKIIYLTNNGYDLCDIESSSISFVYSFDAMVHFEKEVVACYLKDICCILRPGGSAFLHHSNYTGGTDWKQNPCSRNYMSQELFIEYSALAGLSLLHSNIIQWSNYPDLDCLTLVEKTGAP